MKSKKKMFIGGGIFSFLRVPLSINFSFMSRWNNPRASRIIKGKSREVSRRGLCLETEIDMRDGVLEFSETEGTEKVKVLPYLVLSEKRIRLELNLPHERKRTVIIGKPIWCEVASKNSIFKLKIGLLFTAMARETRDKWVHYIKHTDSH